MSTLKKIAEECGVSIKTVSNVVNNYPHVSEKMRLRVMQAIEKTGYVPNETARRMVMNKNGDESYRPLKMQFGCILRPDISKYQNPFFLEVFRAVEEEITTDSNMVSFIESWDVLEKDPLLFNYLCNSEKLNGIISFNYREKFLRKISEICPVVTVGANTSGYDYVEVNFEQGTRIAIKHLKELGHRKIGFIGPFLDLPPDNYKPRYLAFQKIMDELDLEYRREWIVGSDLFFIQSGYDAAKRLLEQDSLPTAVYCVCDEIAYGAMKAFREAGVKIPDDISVIGFDNLPMSDLVFSPLTTVNVNRAKMGRTAVKMLMNRIRNNDLPQQKKIIDVDLTIRESCHKI